MPRQLWHPRDVRIIIAFDPEREEPVLKMLITGYNVPYSAQSRDVRYYHRLEVASLQTSVTFTCSLEHVEYIGTFMDVSAYKMCIRLRDFYRQTRLPQIRLSRDPNELGDQYLTLSAELEASADFLPELDKVMTQSLRSAPFE